MTRRDSGHGSSLVLLLGIVATLAILALALVVVVANAQHNTLQERTRAKSFHVAEAALNAAMANIALNWPTSASVPFPTASFQAQFKPQSGALPEYSASTATDTPGVTVAYFDDTDVNGDGSINASDGPVDSNGNGIMYIDAQAVVLGRASRVRAKVQRSAFQPQVPSTDVLWCGGDLLNAGGGGGVMPKVTVGSTDPLALGGVSVDVLGNIEDYAKGIVQASINTQFGTGPALHNQPKSLEAVFPLSARRALIDYAKLMERYFDENNAKSGMTPLQTAQASPKSKYGGPGLAGLTVIKQSTGTYSLRDQLNTETSPGVLIFLGGLGLDIGGNANFYGLLYVEDGMISWSHGTPTIHGAVYATNDVTFSGTCNLQFDYLALTGFANQTPDYTVNMVPNTWRELRPQ
jgi:Tfp pilus assembly protein PilX